jgi:hypothetical protein
MRPEERMRWKDLAEVLSQGHATMGGAAVRGKRALQIALVTGTIRMFLEHYRNSCLTQGVPQQLASVSP